MTLYPQKEEDVEDLKDLLHSSMQNIVSLNYLVTTLTHKVADLTLSFAESKAALEQRQRTVDKKMADNQEDLEQKLTEMDQEIKAALEGKLTTVGQVVADNKAEVEQRLTEFDQEMANNTAGFKERKATVDQQIADLKIATREVMIVSGEEELSAARCARVCAGTTGRDSTTWSDRGSTAVTLTVDISKCGFVKVPTVTTSIEGTGYHWKATGLAAVYSTTTTSFTMYIDGSQPGHNPTGGNARTWKWNVEWVAVGFTC